MSLVDVVPVCFSFFLTKRWQSSLFQTCFRSVRVSRQFPFALSCVLSDSSHLLFLVFFRLSRFTPCITIFSFTLCCSVHVLCGSSTSVFSFTHKCSMCCSAHSLRFGVYRGQLHPQVFYVLPCSRIVFRCIHGPPPTYVLNFTFNRTMCCSVHVLC